MIENLNKFLFSYASFGTGPRGFQVHGPFLFVVPATVAFILCSIGSLVWVYKDAAKRNKNDFIALIFILLTGWPASFIWWFWLRPPLKNEKPMSAMPFPSLPLVPYPKNT